MFLFAGFVVDDDAQLGEPDASVFDGHARIRNVLSAFVDHESLLHSQVRVPNCLSI